MNSVGSVIYRVSKAQVILGAKRFSFPLLWSVRLRCWSKDKLPMVVFLTRIGPAKRRALWNNKFGLVPHQIWPRWQRTKSEVWLMCWLEYRRRCRRTDHTDRGSDEDIQIIFKLRNIPVKIWYPSDIGLGRIMHKPGWARHVLSKIFWWYGRWGLLGVVNACVRHIRVIWL